MSARLPVTGVAPRVRATIPPVPVTRLDIARYKRLAIRRAEVWQGGLVRLPAWLQEKDDDPPYRVWAGFWRSARTGLVWVLPEDAPHTADAELAARTLVDFARKYDRELVGRPARLEVTSPALAAELAALLDDPDTTIAVVDDLPAVRAALDDFATHESGGRPLPRALLEMPGMTVERLASFADAAAQFYRAAPWDALDAGDLVQVEGDAGIDAGMRYAIVTGSTPDTRGLTCFASRRQFERFEAGRAAGAKEPAPWFTHFCTIDQLPFGDVDAWEDHGLPVASPEAYPRPGQPEGFDGLRRPDARQLASLEAILRAIAASTDDDYDRGEWTRTVTTADGDVEVRLSLPRLLEAMAGEAAGVERPFNPKRPPIASLRASMERAMRQVRRTLQEREPATEEEARRVIESVLAEPATGRGGPAGPPATPLDEAEDLAGEAMAAEGRRRIQLARRALAISRDAADAWCVLAERARDLDRAIALYREAVAAGERALGPKTFAREAGHFWGLIETRPYMRARLGLAECLDVSGATDEAIGHYRELLRLNPDDNQAVHQPLFECLLEAGRDEEAQALIDQFKDDERPEWLFAAALVAFRREGDSTGARARLDVALRSNRHVAAFLTGEREIGHVPMTYRPGSVDEAVICADWLIALWGATPGAVDWLEARAPRPPKRSKRSAPRRQ